MKDIREIMMEMDDLTKKQVAVDLSDEEKEELMNLINTTAESSYNFVSAGGNFGTTTPPITTTPPPTTTCPPEACNEIPFCCAVTFPSELTPVEPLNVNAAVVPKDLTIEPNGQCTFTIGRCTIILDRITISGCVEVFASLGVEDTCGNLTFICCKTCVSISNQEILCCGFNGTDVGFTVTGLTATPVGEACGGAEQVWEISGFITFNCEPCAADGRG